MIRICVLALVILVVGCSMEPPDPKADVKIEGKITDYGQGVYYFDIHGESGTTLAPMLAKWLKEHPTKKVTAIAGNGTGANGCNYGFIVVTEEQ